MPPRHSNEESPQKPHVAIEQLFAQKEYNGDSDHSDRGRRGCVNKVAVAEEAYIDRYQIEHHDLTTGVDSGENQMIAMQYALCVHPQMADVGSHVGRQLAQAIEAEKSPQESDGPQGCCCPGDPKATSFPELTEGSGQLCSH